MFHHIKGKLVSVNPAQAIVESNGLGYLINITLNTYAEISDLKEVLLYLFPIFKEDSQTLFGFTKKSEREVFEKLLSVSGVGGNTARVILSNLSVSETQNAIASGNVGLLKSVKGIGAKTAERIIVDLKDKMLGLENQEPDVQSMSSFSVEAVSALEVLGYTSRQTERVISKIIKNEPNISLEELIKKALNQL